MFKIDYEDTRMTLVTCEHDSYLCSRVSIVNFEQVHAGW